MQVVYLTYLVFVEGFGIILRVSQAVEDLLKLGAEGRMGILNGDLQLQLVVMVEVLMQCGGEQLKTLGEIFNAHSSKERRVFNSIISDLYLLSCKLKSSRLFCMIDSHSMYLYKR
jgi:hypothetical protein